MTDDKPLILVVDDEAITARNVAMALEALGYRTLIAESGETGIKEALEKHPSLIMLDYHLKDIDGIKVLRKIREDAAWGKTAPVIMASNIYDVDVMNTLMELGVSDYVLKSDVMLDELARLVDKHVPAPITRSPQSTQSPQASQ